MSYDVKLCYPDTGETVLVEVFPSNVFAEGGRVYADTSIPYTYGVFFRMAIDDDGIFWLHGKTGQATKRRLSIAIENLTTAIEDETRVLCVKLLYWANAHPTAIWEVH